VVEFGCSGVILVVFVFVVAEAVTFWLGCGGLGEARRVRFGSAFPNIGWRRCWLGW